ncbi:cytochrome P450 [Penicillium malachiteum]|uniref:cytochrome P450 n=1 Tax=Penicillium malachiteum TaxID=1324776 RepID=UPI002546F808|nr:cytochrome P450 [Penicillium malachiteum]KAJ5716006.1 cytochrome P450 [Penicillium malachiteum]
MLLPLSIGATLGIGMHLVLFIRGEWHVQAPDILLGHLLLFISLGVWVNEAGCIILGYLTALFSSIVTYRLFFHRLRSFPGPIWARISKIGHVWKARNAQNHLFLTDLHHQYGDFVRTGPSELTIYHPGVFMSIDGPLTKCDKAEWYDILHPNKALVTARTKEHHSGRRRQWNRGFTSTALKQYHERVLPFIDQLEECIQADISAGRVSETSDLFYWLGFDRMGDLIFGEAFGMLSEKKWHYIIVLLQKALSILGPMSPVPWMVQIAFHLLPRILILGDWFRMRAWCEAQMIKRMGISYDASRPSDIAQYLIEEGPKDMKHQTWLAGDSLLAIVAGSDPTAAVLIVIFTELADRPQDVEKIRREIENLNIEDPNELAKNCPHLEAVILESLRLFPALPTGGYRKTLKESINIGGTFVPPETTIVAPRFPIARRKAALFDINGTFLLIHEKTGEDCFERPNEFIPERWYEKPEMGRNKAAFAPFGTGHHACLGKPLAMSDMRFITARLIRRYRFRYPKGETAETVRNAFKDQFTSKPGQLRLVFEEREN